MTTPPADPADLELPPAVMRAMGQEVLERGVARGRVMLTGCAVDGRFLARICVLSFRTRRRHVEDAVGQIVEEAAGLLAGGA